MSFSLIQQLKSRKEFLKNYIELNAADFPTDLSMKSGIRKLTDSDGWASPSGKAKLTLSLRFLK